MSFFYLNNLKRLSLKEVETKRKEKVCLTILKPKDALENVSLIK